MEYQELVRDFVARTRANLELVERLAADRSCPAYETTQLINSLLGLLVFPQQKYYHEIPDTPLEQLKEQGWPVPKVVGDYPQVDTLKQLFRYLRNSIAHFNMKFHADGSGQLVGVTVWNTPPGKSKPNWKARLEIEELRALVERFSEVIGSLGRGAIQPSVPPDGPDDAKRRQGRG